MIAPRALLAGAALATIPQARDPDPPDGHAVMHLDGRRLLVDLIRMPKPGAEVVALVDQGRGNAPPLDVFTMAPRTPEERGTSFGARTGQATAAERGGC